MSYHILKHWLLPTSSPCWWYNWFSRNNTMLFEKLFWDLTSPHSGDWWAFWGVFRLNDAYLEQKRGLSFIWAPYFSRNHLFFVSWKMMSHRGPARTPHLSLHFHTAWRRPYIFFLRIPKNPWVAPLYAHLYKIQGPLSLHETFFTNEQYYCYNGLNKITSLVVSILCHSSIRVHSGH